jgi:hypothetical protein
MTEYKQLVRLFEYTVCQLSKLLQRAVSAQLQKSKHGELAIKQGRLNHKAN